MARVLKWDANNKIRERTRKYTPSTFHLLFSKKCSTYITNVRTKIILEIPILYYYDRIGKSFYRLSRKYSLCDIERLMLAVSDNSNDCYLLSSFRC